MTGPQFMQMTAPNGSELLVNLDQVQQIQPAVSCAGAVLRLAGGEVLNVQESFDALALRLVFLPFPPRARSEFELAEEADRRQIAMPFAVALAGAVR